MILVTGATGGLGKATIEALINKIQATEIIAMARDLDKAKDLTNKGVQVRQGDYLDYSSLVSAFTGMDTVVLISAPAFTEREIQHRNAIKAAKETGVKHLIYTGIQTRKDSTWIIPMVTESDNDTLTALKESGLSYTYVRNTIYADAVDFLLGPDVLEAGISFPSGDGRLTYATRSELGEALAVLAVHGGYTNQEITLTNSESWSSTDISKMLTDISGQDVPFLNGNRAAYIAHLESKGLPNKYADFGADWAEAKQAGEFEVVDPTLEKLLGRKPTTLKTYLETIYQTK
jgi:NAD(P)H dehydrogenase (quinone)